VNVHLVYTLQQAYMAMQAGGRELCVSAGGPPAGQGHDALQLVQQCVEAVNYYGYDCKIVSAACATWSTAQAIDIGCTRSPFPQAHEQLAENHFTALGTQQFFEHTRLITWRVKDILNGSNPVVKNTATVQEALVVMTKHGFGAVMVADAKGNNVGMFTDGGLRRGVEAEGDKFLHKKLSALKFNPPITIAPEALLDEASKVFKEKKVDTLSVSDNGKQLGMLDIQDLLKATAG
jgi:CBS domain-containing protein